MTTSRIVTLASTIAKDTDIVEEYCRRTGIPSPSFDRDAAPTVEIPPTEPGAANARDNIIAATRELQRLMQGPVETLTGAGHVDSFVYQVISRFRIAECVPTDGEESYEAVAQKCGLETSSLQRILRYAMTNNLFTEPRPNYVGHTSASRLLAEDKLLQSAVAMACVEGFSAASKGCDALELHPGSEDPTLSGWGLANNAQAPFFQELEQRHPARYESVETAMDAIDTWYPNSPLLSNYPWSAVQKMVDVGGGRGPVSLALARCYSTLHSMVQDLPGVVADGQALIPAEYTDRITFMVHDMFEEQPIKDADVYFFRAVLHNWPNSSCIRILRAVVPAIKPGARLVINDSHMPEAGTLSPSVSRVKRKWDLSMMLLFNARDREDWEWASLFERADPRFRFLGVRIPSEGVEGLPLPFLLSIIEAEWDP